MEEQNVKSPRMRVAGRCGKPTGKEQVVCACPVCKIGTGRHAENGGGRQVGEGGELYRCESTGRQGRAGNRCMAGGGGVVGYTGKRRVQKRSSFSPRVGKIQHRLCGGGNMVKSIR